MPRPHVSLCTCTFNDAALADGLLAATAAWSVRPGEIVVCDDGSDPPYVPGDGLPEVRLVRHARNLGITRAKHDVLGAATGEILVFMDCDVRPEPDWLRLCLPLLARPDIGLVCGPVVHDAGQDCVSRYVRAFGDNHHQNASGPVTFVPGNAWAIRREVWERVGGLSGCRRDVCEDHYLSERLRREGSTLWVEPAARVRQIRRLSRVAALARFWKWCHAAFKAKPFPEDALPGLVFSQFIIPLSQRAPEIVDLGSPEFFYLELAYASHVALDLCAFGRTHWGHGDQGERAWWAGLRRLCAGKRRLTALLTADLARLGHAPPSGTEPATQPFAACFEVLAGLGPGVLTWLDSRGVARFLAEEAAGHDFSAYAGADLNEPGLTGGGPPA